MQENQYIVRESLTQALFLLMAEQELNTIRVTDLVRKAGVGRVSFYRNFSNKEDIIISYLKGKSAELLEESKTSQTPSELTVFKFLHQLKDDLLVIHKQGLGHLLYQTIVDYNRQTAYDLGLDLSSYELSFHSGAAWGVIDCWLGQGMVDSPEEVHRQFNPFNLETNRQQD